ncbi:hypothetical protein E2562_025176 [Oryza meyeriana var. granulata]|uniref:Uncharacterized protein n=1 Tax=Oryza meyeriana var. granulata TaxID=110450 RepID=A0A6G1E2E7_9ORYZ|nr:hypothetical protein E2562_025176 [Oryza meyeriana var. granulata]
MAELKVVLARLLSKFAFSRSLRYHHSAAFRLTIEPGFGLTLMTNKADADSCIVGASASRADAANQSIHHGLRMALLVAQSRNATVRALTHLF